MIWDVKQECMQRSELEELQLSRLQELVKRVYERVPFYRHSFDAAGIDPASITSLEDLQRLPFTTKEDLRQNYPFQMFAADMDDVVRIHASSGTTGKPTVVGYTAQDLEVWTESVARMVTQAGITRRDRVQVCFGYGLFTGAFGLHYGLERAGAAVIPASTGNTQKQIMLMQDFGTTALVCTPSYALHLGEVALEMGVNPLDLPIRLGLFGAEPWTESMRSEIEHLWGIKATDNYGLSELIGPGVAGECECRTGMHISEDHFLVEVIDPDSGAVLPYGAEGELVFTTLTKDAFPVIRYRTKDISVLYPEKCACGRTTVRMRKVLGRTDDMLIIRGINVFPSQIETVLIGVEGASPHYQIIVDRQGHLDSLEVLVEVSSDNFSDKYKELALIQAKLQEQLRSILSISAKVRLVEPKTLERSVGKAQRVIDKRR
ncbi:MAG: phenylacetate--CoA ligase [Peptococcaceae bacterium]|nr:phenylacetate--CoA ligase [Peptococcaceae bacterium]